MTSSTASKAVQTIIIGAGIVGCSIAYHLAKMGYRDVMLVDRTSPGDPAGSTGHAPGLLAQISAAPSMTRLAQLSAALYRELPPGNPAYCTVGSIEVARDEATMCRFHDKVERGAQAGIVAQIVDVAELKSLMPLMNVEGLIGGVLVPSDGVLDARRALSGLAAEITQADIEIRSGTTVTGIEMAHGKVVGVATDKGFVACDRVIVAVGIWGATFMKALGVEIPLFPVQHPYLYTEPLAEWRDEAREATHPFVRDLDHVAYYRQHGKRMG